MAEGYDPKGINGLLYGPDKQQYAVTGGGSYQSLAGVGNNVGYNDPRFQYFANMLNPNFTGTNDTSAFGSSLFGPASSTPSPSPASSIVNSPTPNVNASISGTTNVALPKSTPASIPTNPSLTSPNQNPTTPINNVSSQTDNQMPTMMNNPLDRNKRLQTFGVY